MKTLQKATLAAAIAAAPFFATNALEALDDEALSNMTGQAGVTIETTTDEQGIRIGSIQYTDTDGIVEGSDDGGSVYIGGDVGDGYGITVTGVDSDGNAAKTTTKQTIDVSKAGHLITESKEITGNFKQIKVGEVQLRANGAETGAQLVSNLTLVQEEGASSAHILNLSDIYQQDGTIEVGDTGITEAAGKYTYDVKSSWNGAVDKTVKLDGAISDKSDLAIVSKGSSRIVDMEVTALDGAVSISGLKYGKGANAEDMMESTQVIWAKGGNAYATQADVTAGNATEVGQDLGGGVYIQGSDSTGTLIIGSVGIGGNSIGSITIQNINQAGSTQRIYGH